MGSPDDSANYFSGQLSVFASPDSYNSGRLLSPALHIVLLQRVRTLYTFKCLHSAVSVWTSFSAPYVVLHATCVNLENSQFIYRRSVVYLVQALIILEFFLSVICISFVSVLELSIIFLLVL